MGGEKNLGINWKANENRQPCNTQGYMWTLFYGGKGTREKTKPKQKSRRRAENPLDELPGPSSLPISSAMSCQKLLAAWPASPTLNGCDSNGDKRNGTAGEYWGLGKGKRRDEISVGMEEGGRY